MIIDVPSLLAVKEPRVGQCHRSERIRRRREARVERDGPECVWCGGIPDERSPLSAEHVIPRGLGGLCWAQNEVNACERCNTHRQRTMPFDYLDACRARGLDCRPQVVIGALWRFDIALRRPWTPATTSLKSRVGGEIRKMLNHPDYEVVGPIPSRLCDKQRSVPRPRLAVINGAQESAPRAPLQAPCWPSLALAPAALAIPA